MIVDGKKIAEEILTGLKSEIINSDKNLSLAAILVGDDEEFRKFVELKGKRAEEIGIGFEMFNFPENIQEKELVDEVGNILSQFDGILVEIPLPSHLNQQKTLDLVPTSKDVDVLSNEAQKLFNENKFPILPPAVEALKIVLEKFNIDPKEKKVAVFGQGILVGDPISHWLEYKGAQVFLINSKTKNPEEYSKQADIIVTGVGKPGLITGDMVKDGVIVVDFGYGKDKNGAMKGDVDFESVSPKASYITPVPGGMGPILIAAVLKNLISLNEK